MAYPTGLNFWPSVGESPPPRSWPRCYLYFLLKMHWMHLDEMRVPKLNIYNAHFQLSWARGLGLSLRLLVLPALIHGLGSARSGCSHSLNRVNDGNLCWLAQWWKRDMIFCLARAAFPININSVWEDDCTRAKPFTNSLDVTILITEVWTPKWFTLS